MRRTWTFPAATAAALLAHGAPPAAVAEDFAFSPSLFVQFSFGSTWNIGLGLDLRGAALFESASCFEDARQSGLGVYAQGVLLFRDLGFQFGAGLHGGVQPRRTGFAWEGELGWMWRTSTDLVAGGHGLQLGILGSFVPTDMAVRATFHHDGDAWVPEGHLSGGFRFPGVFGADGSFCVEGRPQRGDGGALVVGRVWTRAARQRPSVGQGRRAAGIAWVEAARAEAASVPAFLALARDLAAVDAPAALVARALAAARDEVRHAGVCAAVARRLLGVSLQVEVPSMQPASTTDRTEALVRLAVASFNDGLVGEGAAARRARAGADVAGSRRVRVALRRIARDEQGHATLARAVLAFCVEAGGAPVVAALQALPVESGGAVAAGTPGDGWLWRRAGRASGTATVTAQRAAEHAAERVRAVLLSPA